jgi:hypothetical protein
MEMIKGGANSSNNEFLTITLTITITITITI